MGYRSDNVFLGKIGFIHYDCMITSGGFELLTLFGFSEFSWFYFSKTDQI